jgi:hypothetical protein
MHVELVKYSVSETAVVVNSCDLPMLISLVLDACLVIGYEILSLRPDTR